MLVVATLVNAYISIAQHLHLIHDALQLHYFSQQDPAHQELLVLVFEIENANLDRNGFHRAVCCVRPPAEWGGLIVRGFLINRAGGARPGFGLVLGGDDETVPEEDFGGYGHVEEGEVRLLDGGRVEQFVEGVDGRAVEVEDFVKGWHEVCDLSEVRAGAYRRLLQLAKWVLVKHGARVERVEGSERFGFAVARCYSG